MTLTSLCCRGAERSCPVSLEGESCRPEDSLQPPDAAAASSCCRLPDCGELAEAAAVVGVCAEEVAATDEGGGGGGGEASGSAVTNGFSGVMASNGEITQLATMVARCGRRSIAEQRWKYCVGA